MIVEAVGIADGERPIPPPATAKRQPLPLLTSLRFFAALDVLFYHRAPTLEPGFLRNLTASGYDAVSFFFILSGFVLLYAYGAPAASVGITTSRGAFWWARVVRIMPAYLLGLLIASPLFVYSGLVSRVSPFADCVAGLVLLPLLLQAWWPPIAIIWNGPAWSLSVEAFFYALFPFLADSFGRWPVRYSLPVVAGLLLAVAVTREAITAGGNPSVFYTNMALYLPLLHLPQFLLGMALCRWFLDTGGAAGGRWRAGLFPLGIAFTLALFGLRSWLPTWCLSAPIQAIAFGTLIFGAAAAKFPKFLCGKLMLMLGEASYSLYILHEPIATWWNRSVGGLGENGLWWSFAMYGCTVTIASVACFLWVETPCRRWLYACRGRG